MIGDLPSLSPRSPPGEASSLGDASAFGRLDAEDTEPSHVPSKTGS